MQPFFSPLFPVTIINTPFLLPPSIQIPHESSQIPPPFHPTQDTPYDPHSTALLHQYFLKSSFSPLPSFSPNAKPPNRYQSGFLTSKDFSSVENVSCPGRTCMNAACVTGCCKRPDTQRHYEQVESEETERKKKKGKGKGKNVLKREEMKIGKRKKRLNEGTEW